jgi:hypothetical protein
VIYNYLFGPSSEIMDLYYQTGRSQRSRGLRHDLSSLTRTLESCVRIPLKAWMSVCAFVLCLWCDVCR